MFPINEIKNVWGDRNVIFFFWFGYSILCIYWVISLYPRNVCTTIICNRIYFQIDTFIVWNARIKRYSNSVFARKRPVAPRGQRSLGWFEQRHRPSTFPCFPAESPLRSGSVASSSALSWPPCSLACRNDSHVLTQRKGWKEGRKAGRKGKKERRRERESKGRRKGDRKGGREERNKGEGKKIIISSSPGCQCGF